MQPEKISIQMSPFTNWMWGVHRPDGTVIKRFKSDEELNRWLDRNGYTVAAAGKDE